MPLKKRVPASCDKAKAIKKNPFSAVAGYTGQVLQPPVGTQTTPNTLSEELAPGLGPCFAQKVLLSLVQKLRSLPRFSCRR